MINIKIQWTDIYIERNRRLNLFLSITEDIFLQYEYEPIILYDPIIYLS